MPETIRESWRWRRGKARTSEAERQHQPIKIAYLLKQANVILIFVCELCTGEPTALEEHVT